MNGSRERLWRPEQTVVLHIVNSIGIGGAEKQLSQLVAEIAARGGTPQLVVPLVDADARTEFPAGLAARPPHRRICAVPWSVWRAVRALRANPSCLVVAWMYHSWIVAMLAALIARRSTSRLVLYCRHGEVNSLSVSTRFIAKMILRIARARSIPVVFNSDVARRSHEMLVPGIRGFMIPNGITLPDRRERRTPRVIGFLGRNHPDKGADRLKSILPAILAALPACSAVVAGPGMEARRPELDAAMAGHALETCRLKVEGVVDAPRFFEEIDVLIVPSRAESFPNVVLEAMAWGVVPVSMDVGGMREIIDGTVPLAGNVDQLVRIAIGVCSMEPDALEAVRSRLFESVKLKYSLAAVVDRHVHCWAEVC